MTKAERLAYQRQRRKETHNIYTKRYEKSKKGFLMRTYRNMESRTKGIQWKKAHLYLGLPVLDRADFYQWSLTDSAFNVLFEVWESKNYDRKLTPSINRINTTNGYIFGNIEWITHSENSRRGSSSQHKKEKK